jgi:hypothetical protein
MRQSSKSCRHTKSLQAWHQRWYSAIVSQLASSMNLSSGCPFLWNEHPGHFVMHSSGCNFVTTHYDRDSWHPIDMLSGSVSFELLHGQVGLMTVLFILRMSGIIIFIITIIIVIVFFIVTSQLALSHSVNKNNTLLLYWLFCHVLQ